jgi:hypothetical protein
MIITIVKESFLTTISALGYVVRKLRSRYSSNSCHERNYVCTIIKSRNKYGVPELHWKYSFYAMRSFYRFMGEVENGLPIEDLVY